MILDAKNVKEFEERAQKVAYLEINLEDDTSKSVKSGEVEFNSELITFKKSNRFALVASDPVIHFMF